MCPSTRCGHHLERFIAASLFACTGVALGQAPAPAKPSSPGFNVSPPKDEILGHDKNAELERERRTRVDSPDRTVGPQRDGSIVVSDNQVLTPAGKLIELGSPVRAKAIAINPAQDAHTAAVLLMGSPEPIVVFDTGSGAVLQRFLPGDEAPAASAKDRSTGSFAGITYSSDGQKLLFSQDNNYVAVARVDRKTGLLSNEQRVQLPAPPADGRHYHNAKSINPGSIAFSSDNKRAYVALNAANTLGVLDLTNSPAALVKQISVGNVPNSVLVRGNYAYVSNEGGRPAVAGDFTNTSDGTPLVVDRMEAYTTTGTVSVVDLNAGKEIASIPVGLHPVGMTIVGDRLFVANAYSDSLSIVDLRTNKVTRTISLSVPIAKGVFGSGPNGVAVTPEGKAYISLGQANAVAVVNLQGRDANPVLGYIPTAYFPTSISYDRPRRQLVLADDKGLGSRGTTTMTKGAVGYNTHADTGVVNLVPEPNASELARFSKQVFANNQWDLTTNIEVGKEFIDPHAVPVAVPKHIGEPSLIKHVFLIIKENRTYDQMLGDVAWGNGAPELAMFAPAVPNQHALVKRFPLLDNVYAPSRQSADGHPWIGMSGSFYSNDILAPDWIRSYPGGEAEDALTNTPQGFLWTDVAAKGLTARMYGEWSSGTTVARKSDGSAYTWSDFFRTSRCKEGKAPASDCVVPDDAIHVTSAIPSAARIMDPRFPPFNLDIPDQYRADLWIEQFKHLDASGQVPNLTILWLPDDHTAGTSKGHPYPLNYQADNDLALGRMVDAISHSKVWSKSAIFVEEDDSQGGVDHVDGHRQPVFIISPYTVSPQAPGQGKAIHTTYTAENINRTIENILGTAPLTQFDLVASPMFDAFQNTPDLAPFDCLPATMPLDQGPDLPAGKETAYSPVEKAWLKATAKVMKDKYDKADAVDPNFLNHVTWYATAGWDRPYPGETKVLPPEPLVKAAKKYADDDDD